MNSKRIILAAALMTAASPALAHTGSHTLSGFEAGFLHPLGGLDHALAMVTVGIIAALIGGRALWAVPASFVIMMVLGGVLGLAGVTVPAAETGIAASLVVLGGIVAVGRSWSVGAATGLVGLFAVFHGYAHGVEMPAGADTALYSLGFALGSALLHGAGITLGRIPFAQARAARWAGLSVTLAGLVLAFG